MTENHERKSRKTKRDGCEKRNAFIETKTKCASNLIRKVTAYLQNQSKTPSLFGKNKRHSNGLLTLFEYRFLLPAVVKKRLLKLFIPYFFRTFTK